MFKAVLKKIWLHLPTISSLYFKPKKNTYLFLPINGAGLGHLTRTLAIARKLKLAEPDADIIFLTTSIAVPLVHRAGFICHHVTPAALAGNSVGSAGWNQLFFKSIDNVLSLYKPGTLVFDGAFPYVGLRRIINSYKNIKYIWVKRGLYKESVDNSKIDQYIKLFDRIITPSELVKENPSDEIVNNKLFPVSPICLLDRVDLLGREQSIRYLNLDPLRPRVYVQLGAGNINGIADLQSSIVASLQKRDIQVVLGKSPISLNSDQNPVADSVIVDYPNSQYFSAFDFAVLAGGYNSVCEAVSLGLPAIFFPNMSTGTDDQLKRVQQARVFGAYEVVTEFNEVDFESAVENLLRCREKVGENFQLENGANQAAIFIRDAIQ